MTKKTSNQSERELWALLEKWQQDVKHESCGSEEYNNGRRYQFNICMGELHKLINTRPTPEHEGEILYAIFDEDDVLELASFAEDEDACKQDFANCDSYESWEQAAADGWHCEKLLITRFPVNVQNTNHEGATMPEPGAKKHIAMETHAQAVDLALSRVHIPEGVTDNHEEVTPDVTNAQDTEIDGLLDELWKYDCIRNDYSDETSRDDRVKAIKRSNELREEIKSLFQRKDEEKEVYRKTSLEVADYVEGLKKELAEAREEIQLQREFIESDEKERKKAETLIKDLKQQLASAEGKWIPVSERLPEKGGEYLVWYSRPDTQPGGIVKIRGFLTYYPVPCFQQNDDVTHWMPLPAPPADSGKEGEG